MFAWNCLFNVLSISYSVFTKSLFVLCLVYTAVKPSHILLSIWTMWQRGAANPLTLHELCLLFPYSLYVSCNQETKFGGQLTSSNLQPHQADCLLLCWLRTDAHNAWKVWIPGAKGPFAGLCTPRAVWGERNGSVSRPGPRERWKDNSPPLLSLDLMRRQTICEQWHSQIGPKGYEWETSKPAHVSATVKGFV